MSLTPTKGNSILLTICQNGFNSIVDGTMPNKLEFRPIKASTLSRYVLRTKKGLPYLNLAHTNPTESYKIDDYNDGHFPFLLRQYSFLHFAVGYTTERDECVVHVEDILLEPRNYTLCDGREKCEWWIGFKLSQPLLLRRKGDVYHPKIVLPEGENTIDIIPENAIVQNSSAK